MVQITQTVTVSGTPEITLSFDTRADALLAQTGDSKFIQIGGLKYAYDASGTALTTGDGRKWSPAGDVASFGHFGLIGDGASDDSVAMQRGFDWAAKASQRQITGEPGAIYAIGSNITGTAHVNVDWNGAKVKRIANVGFDFACAPSVHDLTADYSAGDTTITVASTDAALAVGRPVKIHSDAVQPANRDEGSNASQYRMGETFIVGSGSTDTLIALTRPLQFPVGISPASTAGDEARVTAYTTTLNAKIIVLDNTYAFRMVNLDIYDDVPGTYTADVVQIEGYVNPVVRKTRMQGAGGSGLVFRGCYNPRSTDFTGVDIAVYHIVEAGCYGGRHVNPTFIRGRHGFTTSGATASANTSNTSTLLASGINQNCKVVRGTGEAFADFAPFDTHHDAVDVSFVDCVARGCGGFGMQGRGRNIRFIRPIIRECGKGLLAFTEYESGDPDDDLYTAGKEPEDLTSCLIDSPYIRCDEEPLTVSAAFANITGIVDYIGPDHRVIWNIGGNITCPATIAAKVLSGGGTDNVGIFECIDVTAELVNTLESVMTLSGRIDVDASAASATGISVLDVDTDSSLILGATAIVKVPSGASFKAGSGVARCELGGVVSLEVDGAADNSIVSGAADLENLRVQSVDGSVDWDDVTKDLRLVFRDGDVAVSHAGTGSEVQNVYVPNGQAVCPLMNAAGSGRIKFMATGNKVGTNGQATISIRSGASNFVHNFEVDQNANRFDISGICDFYGVDQQRHVGIANDFTDTGSTHNTFSKANTETEAYLASSDVAFRLGITAAVGDTVNIQTCEVFATRGGVF